MIKQVFDIMNNNFPFANGKHLGIAVSGGLDSMTLVHLLNSNGYKITLLHCNFKLRGEESDQDLSFLEKYSRESQLSLKVIGFDTNLYASKNKISTQMAARELRYNWFDQLVKEGKVDFILTAHHGNDSIETMFINLTRGSGLSGLMGIPERITHTIRPLLSFRRSQLEEYAKSHNLEWREDSSNATDAYMRNAIRHKVIPELEALSLDFVKKAMESQAHLRESQMMLREYTNVLMSRLVKNRDSSFVVNLTDLETLSSPKGFLFEWLKPYEFTAWDDIVDLLTAQSGKHIASPNFLLTKNRGELILSKKTKGKDIVVNIPSGVEKLDAPISLIFNDAIDQKINNKNEIIVDADLLQFPLQLRHWQDGDRFYPLGMEGSKKVSDYFTDLKISRPEKENFWLLCSSQKIVWIVGLRGDNRFKAGPKTTNSIAITYSP